LPFGRRILLELDPQGEAVIGQHLWENTAFGAAIDQGLGKQWPQTCRALLKSASEGDFYYGTRKTQLRHIQGGGELLGLQVEGLQQTARLQLGIDQNVYQKAGARIRDGPSPLALGLACTELLANLALPSMEIFEKMFHLGQKLGFWGVWANHLGQNVV
jgi:hypothetical protein